MQFLMSVERANADENNQEHSPFNEDTGSPPLLPFHAHLRSLYSLTGEGNAPTKYLPLVCSVFSLRHPFKKHLI